MRELMPWYFSWIFIFGLCLGCTNNIFDEIAVKDSDEALIFEAQKKVNNREYGEALDLLALVSAAGRDKREVKRLRASAHAGVCGLDFVTFALGLRDLGTERLFVFLADLYSAGTEARQTACSEAESLLTGISEASPLTVDENVFLAFVSLTRTGVILSRFGDRNADGVVDGSDSFDPCNATHLPNTDVRQLGLSLVLTLNAISAAQTTIGSDAIGDLSGICDDLAGLGGGLNFCDSTDSDSYTADQLRAIRTLVNESTILGLGTCTGDVTACLCL